MHGNKVYLYNIYTHECVHINIYNYMYVCVASKDLDVRQTIILLARFFTEYIGSLYTSLLTMCFSKDGR